MSVTLKLKSEGLDGLVTKLDTLIEPKLADRRIATAMRASAKPILAAAKTNMPVRYGFLQSALILTNKVIKSGKDRGLRSVRVGANNRRVFQLLKKESPRSNAFSLQLKNKNKKDKTISKPHKYLHLIEFGTKTAKAYSPLRKAYRSNGGPRQVKLFANGIDKAITRIMKKKGKADAS